MVDIHQHEVNSLLSSLNDGVCCLSAQGNLLYSNEIAQRHWKLHQEHTSKLFTLPPVARAVAGEHVHHALVHLDEDHVLLLNTLPLYGGTSSITAIVIISRDVSQHVLLEQQAETSLYMLVEAVMDTQDIREIDEALRRIAALLPQLDSVDNSIAFRIDEQTGRLRPLALFGSSQQSYEEWRAELSALELNTEKALQSSPAYIRALRLKTPIMVDFTSTPTQSHPRNLCAAIYAPVLLNGQVLGLLGVERHRPLGNADTYFPQWSVELLTALARLVSMSIEKTSLLDSSARQQEEIEVVRKLLSQKEEFLSLTAHELKNPLTAIRGQAQVLQRHIKRLISPDTKNPHELIRGLESIEQQTRKIEHMINTLLDVSRLDLDRLQLELQEIDLLQLTRRTLEGYLPIARDHELSLFVNGQPIPIHADNQVAIKEPIKIMCDEERLEQVLLNLLSNAMKYSPGGGPITVSLRSNDDDTVEISVEDRGIGIPPAEQARLTERFFRAQNARHIDAKGLGLGLHLVNALVMKHGGSLAIISEGVPGKGSTFTVKLPYQ